MTITDFSAAGAIIVSVLTAVIGIFSQRSAAKKDYVRGVEDRVESLERRNEWLEEQIDHRRKDHEECERSKLELLRQLQSLMLKVDRLETKAT